MADLLSAAESFVTEGERRAAEVLKQLPDNWLVICNKTLSTSNERSYEMDFIVVGRRWVFLIDEKSWRGRIRGNDELWIRSDGSSERSPLGKVDYISKVLAGHLSWRIPELKDGGHFVRGGVLLSAADQPPQILDSRAANGVFLLDDVCQRLRSLDARDGNPLVGQVHNRIKNSLVDLSNRPEMPSRVGLYTIEDVIMVRPGVRLFHAAMDGGEPRLLLVYDLGRDPLAAQEQYDFFLREFKALKELRATGLVAEVQDPFRWSDDFLVLPIVPLKGEPLSVFQRPETRDELAQELLLAAASFKGLDVIHNKNILHRAIGPDIVYVLQKGQAPKVAFTNFFAARLGTSSIADPLDELALASEDPYAALDLAIGYEFATPATDTFSLTLVFLERIAGVSIRAIRASTEDDVKMPDLQKRWSIVPPQVTSELSHLFQQIILPEKQEPPLTAKEIAGRFNGLARYLRTDALAEEEMSLLNGRFKVLRVLGQGSMAKTYLATYAEQANAALGPFVLKRLLRPDEVYGQAVAEYGALRQIKSKYLPRIEDIYTQQDDAHIKMEYIPGPTLKELEASFPWPIDRWWSFAQGIMNAVETLENKQLLHRDIKPENIIISEDEQYPVLIDFGLAVQQSLSSEAGIAGTPLYLPPEAISAHTSPQSCDRYAVGVVLFKVLTGYLPFERNKAERLLRLPANITNLGVRRIANVLLRVISNNPSERPGSIEQMRRDLQAAVLTVEETSVADELSERVNGWVDEIRSLYRNSESGNANNRGLDTQFVRETYVQTALDERLLPNIFAHRPKVVFLSGNPGDGKTAFLGQVRQKLEEKQAQFTRSDESGWECVYDGHTYRSCYDASEAHEGLSADEQLSQKLQGLEGTQEPAVALTVLIAINDGRLFDYFDRQKQRFQWLSLQKERFTNGGEIERLPVWVVDLKRRTFVHIPDTEPSIFTNVLERLVDPQRWQVCEDCAAKAICPIRGNATALRKHAVSKWLEYLLLLTHLRQQRQMTMRDLRSAIAYLITGNISCQQVHEARQGNDAGASLIDFSYWRSAFAPLESNDELLQDLASLDPARFAQPHLDRFLHFHQSLEEVSTRQMLYLDHTDLPAQRFRDEREWIASTKRRLYFEVVKAAKNKQQTPQAVPTIRRLDLLPYRFARNFIKLLDNDSRLSKEDVNWFREQLALGILRSDGIVEAVPPDKLSVRVSSSVEQQLVVLKQFPIEEFNLFAAPLRGIGLIEQIPVSLILEHRSKTPRLEISLDLFELLMRIADGLQPDAQEYQPLLEDLRRFKDVLLLKETRDLVLIENQRRVHHITQRSGRLIRTSK